MAGLKHQGYRHIVFAGQSFGAFLALMAADASTDVDAVVATAPAAFGGFDGFRLLAPQRDPALLAAPAGPAGSGHAVLFPR